MHIHKEYSRPSLSDYLDNHSELAVYLLAKITHLLTHSFQVANDNSFQFYGHTLGCHHINDYGCCCPTFDESSCYDRKGLPGMFHSTSLL